MRFNGASFGIVHIAKGRERQPFSPAEFLADTAIDIFNKIIAVILGLAERHLQHKFPLRSWLKPIPCKRHTLIVVDAVLTLFIHAISMNTFQYHLGIDLHKETSYWTLMDHERTVLYKKNLPTSKEGMERGIREMNVAPSLVEAAIEPVSQWGWYGDLLEKEGLTVHLVDVYKSKLIAGTKLKIDRVDSLTLADMMRSDFLPTAYRAPETTRDLREFMRHRAFLVRLRARVRGRVHQILWKHGVIS